MEVSTDREVLGLKPSARPYEVGVTGTRGLSVRVLLSGDRVFELRYAGLGGKRRRMQLGAYPAMSLSQARVEAGRLRNEVIAGRDPIADRMPAPAPVPEPSVSALAADYFVAAAAGLHGGRKRPKTPATIAAEKRQFATYIKPELGHRPYAGVRRADVRALMTHLATSGDLAPASVARIGETLSGIFAFAVNEDRIEHSPVRGLAHPLALTSRDRRFDDAAVTKLWRVLKIHSAPRAPDQKCDDEISRLAPQTCLAIRYLIVTLARRGEVSGARWAEINRRDRTWEIPAERTKERRADVKPLSAEALAILDAAAAIPGASNEFIFPAIGDPTKAIEGGRLTRAIARLCDRLKLAHGSPHDIRRSGATTLTSCYGVSGYVAGLLLGHKVFEGAAITAVYDRYDRLPEKRAALDTWTSHVLAIADGQYPTNNVIAFPAVQAS